MSRPTSPFKFLDSYGQGDRDIFFGREQETDDLYQALSGVKHLLVYGPSGAGKTSLIECGLRNQFSDADWFALTIRRGTNITDSVFAAINEALTDKIPLDAASKRPLDEELDFGQAVENLFGERYQPVYLLFDQFEELLISGSEEEKTEFFTRLNQLVRYKTPCRVLLIMREEFIGHLSEFEPLCPSLFQHRFRVEKMRKEKVKEVIRCTLDAPLFLTSFRVDDSSQLADRLLSKLPDKSREIELAHVQVFLSELWERAAEVGDGAALPALHEGLVRPEDNLAGVLDGFLKKQLAELDKVYGEKAPLEALAAMISERHTKLQLSAEALQQELTDKAVPLKAPLATLLQDLERRRILRTIRSGEQVQYEISHDVLALVVGRNLTEEMQLREKAREIYRVYEGREGLLSQEDMDYLRPFGAYLVLPEGLEGRMRESEGEIVRRQQAELEYEKERQGMKLEHERKVQERNKEIYRVGCLLILVAPVALLFYITLANIARERDEELEKLERSLLFQSTIITMQATTTTALYNKNNPTNIYYDSIKVLKLNSLNLNKLPEQVLLLKNLESLDLRDNKLSNLPSEIGNLTNLEFLGLSGNELSGLPSEIGNLTNLKFLYLDVDFLKEIPSGIRNLTRLENLYLGVNKLYTPRSKAENMQVQLKEWLPGCDVSISSIFDILQINQTQIKITLPDSLKPATTFGDLGNVMDVEEYFNLIEANHKYNLKAMEWPLLRIALDTITREDSLGIPLPVLPDTIRQ